MEKGRGLQKKIEGLTLLVENLLPNGTCSISGPDLCKAIDLANGALGDELPRSLVHAAVQREATLAFQTDNWNFLAAVVGCSSNQENFDEDGFAKELSAPASAACRAACERSESVARLHGCALHSKAAEPRKLRGVAWVRPERARATRGSGAGHDGGRARVVAGEAPS